MPSTLSTNLSTNVQLPVTDRLDSFPELMAATWVWALAASAVMHLAGFAMIQYSGAMVLNEAPSQEAAHVLQATLLPVNLVATTQLGLSSQGASLPAQLRETSPTGFKLETLSPATDSSKPITRATFKSIAAPRAKRAQNQPEPSATQAGDSASAKPHLNPSVPANSNSSDAAPLTASAVLATSDLAAATAPLAPPLPLTPTALTTPVTTAPAALNLPVMPTPSVKTDATASPTGAGAIVTANAAEHATSAPHSASRSSHSAMPQYPQYQLPNQATVRYEAHVSGLSGKSVLSWKKTIQEPTPRYEAQLTSTATILFKTFEHRYKSSGIINATGLMPLAVEEKRTNGSTVATSVEPENKRVIISSKEGFLPYDPLGKDLVSLMLQLSIYTQTQPLWLKAGTAQDFTVYRPSGIKRWRFQSMGLETIAIKDQSVQAVYIKRVPLSAEPDYEDQHHFWLLPSKYGFPAKMRLVDNKGRSTDIVMTDWQEQ